MLARESRAAFRRLHDEIGTVDAVGIEERVAKYATRSIKKASKVRGLKLAVSMLDLTNSYLPTRYTIVKTTIQTPSTKCQYHDTS